MTAYTKNSSTVGPARYTNYNRGVVFDTSTGDPDILRSDLSGQFDPLFKATIRSRGNATTPLDASRTTCVRADDVYWDISNLLYGNGHGFRMLGSGSGKFGSSSPSFESEARAGAVTLVNKFIRESQNPLYAQTIAAEASEAIHFVSHPLQQTVKLIKSYSRALHALRMKARKSRSNVVLRDIFKEHANSWLEFRFGILPLISDVQTIMAIANESLVKKQRSRFGYQVPLPVSDNGTRSYHFGFSRTITDTTTIVVSNYIHIGFITEAIAGVTTLSDSIVQDLTNSSEIIPTLWEVTPYSWLFDYFVNVGDILNSHVNVSSYSSYTSDSLVIESTWNQLSKDWIYDRSDPLIRVFGSQAELIYKQRSVSRRTLQSLIPPVVFHMPGSKIRYANLSALLLQKLL